MPRIRNSALEGVTDLVTTTTTIVLTQPSPDRVRSAQLALASAAADDPRAAALADDPRERDALREALEALGIFNKHGRIMTRPVRRPARTEESVQPSQAGLPRTYRFSGEREPNGRLSRRARGDKIDERS